MDERVLVPRQDTEVLVEEAISRMRNLEKPQILDMCTGSGCILLSLLLELPQALGTGVVFQKEHFVWQRRIENVWDWNRELS